MTRKDIAVRAAIYSSLLTGPVPPEMGGPPRGVGPTHQGPYRGHGQASRAHMSDAKPPSVDVEQREARERTARLLEGLALEALTGHPPWWRAEPASRVRQPSPLRS